jgi:hypothetical protein
MPKENGQEGKRLRRRIIYRAAAADREFGAFDRDCRGRLKPDFWRRVRKRRPGDGSPSPGVDAGETHG